MLTYYLHELQIYNLIRRRGRIHGA